VQRQSVSSGGPFEDIYGYHRAVRVGGHVHVSGTTAREPDLDADAYTQALAAFAIIEEALLGVRSPPRQMPKPRCTGVVSIAHRPHLTASRRPRFASY